jgi:vacuolar-type H+-ATPase subunit E/Vma4
MARGSSKQLLADLLRQSAVAIAADADVLCRQQDEAIVKSLLKQAQDAAETATGKSVKLTLSKEKLDDETSWGGVTLKSAKGGKVVCDNTLAARLTHCFEEQLPTVRHYLFHEKASLDA